MFRGKNKMLKATLAMQLPAFQLDLALSTDSGQTIVLLGESGAGKSTVLRLLAGLIHPQYGSIELDGTIYFDSEKKIACAPQRRPFGYVFQDYTLFPHLNVYENVAFGLKAQGMAGPALRQRVGEALEQVHLVGYDRRRPGQLSGGQQQRVALARALVLQPKLLLLDEPLSALDTQTRREVRQELRRILQQTRLTTVLVTHQYVEALIFGHTILVLDHGRVIQQGTQRDLLQHPRSNYVAELVGINFFQGRVTQCESRSICTIELGNHEGQGIAIQAALEEGAEDAPEIGEEACVVVDPRSVILSTEPPESSARNVLRGEIVQILRAGSQSSGWVRVNLQIAASTLPLIAEITESSVERLQINEGHMVYATFKTMEALAYV
jgi:molybdate transport system ATP-binding protein